MSRGRWLNEHFNDRYVQLAKKMKIRSRAWFKIYEIDRIDFLISSGMRVVDLGAFPGSWSMYARMKVGQHGRVIACDILSMDKIVGVYFLQGDISTSNMLQTLINVINKKKVNVILSDMSPNVTGIADIDVTKSIYLGEVALNVCKYILMFGGNFLVKIFQGDGFNKYFNDVCSLFNIVNIRKPNASHMRSREVYIVAKGYKNNSISCQK